MDYGIEHYFREPNYWRAQGGLFFSIYQATRFVKELGGPQETRTVLAKMDDRLHKAGLPSMHWNGMVSNAKDAAVLKEAGFTSTSRYGMHEAKIPARLHQAV